MRRRGVAAGRGPPPRRSRRAALDGRPGPPVGRGPRPAGRSRGRGRHRLVVGHGSRRPVTSWRATRCTTASPSGRSSSGFDVVVGNPPFQGQLARDTVRSAADATQLTDRFGGAVTAYVDTAALFLLASVDLVRPGGRVALVQPQSTVASRDAGGVRAALARAGATGRPVGAERSVVRGQRARVRPRARGRPPRAVRRRPHLGRSACRRTERADRRARLGTGRWRTRPPWWPGSVSEYYGLVGHVREADWPPGRAARDVRAHRDRDHGLGRQAGAVRQAAVGAPRRRRRGCPAREPAHGQLARPACSDRRSSWPRRRGCSKAAADHDGTWVPCTPAVSVVPTDPADVDRVAAVLCAPPVAAWALRRAVGTGLSPDAIRVSAGLLADAPLPTDARAWTRPRRSSLMATSTRSVPSPRPCTTCPRTRPTRWSAGGLAAVPGEGGTGLPRTGPSSVGSRRHQEWPG